MTNFEFYTKNAARLGELIEKAVDDALEAKGCSLDLKYPEKRQQCCRENQEIQKNTAAGPCALFYKMSFLKILQQLDLVTVQQHFTVVLQFFKKAADDYA